MPRAMVFQIGFYFPIFYLQLDAVNHGIDVNFSFYSVRLRLSCSVSTLNSIQLVIMNPASFIGRCTTGPIAAYMGVLNLMIVSTVACSALTVSMIALSDKASVIVLGVGNGYFSGICMFHTTASMILGTIYPSRRAVGVIGGCADARFVRARVRNMF